MSNSFWSEVKLEIPVDLEELVAEVLEEEGAGGVVYDDPRILEARPPLETDELIGEELLRKIPERFGLRAYFPVDDRLGERLARLRERIGLLLGYQPEFELRQVQEEEWAEAWKSFFKPEHLGKIVIKPSWEEYAPVGDEIVIELDPGMAFGTGTHPTTRLCVLLLQEIINRPVKVLDLGTGSGILSLAAAKLGTGPVTATDIDPLAVKIAQENVRRNQLSDRVTVTEANLLQLKSESKFDLVVANIIANAIVELIPGLDGVLEPGGSFLASGIIDTRFPDVQSTLEQHGFSLVKTVTHEGWVALIATKTQK
jgi:ribosomal protein L11 methyltransferase